MNFSQSQMNHEQLIPPLFNLGNEENTPRQNGRIPTLRLKTDLQEMYQTTKHLHKDDQKENS